MHRQLKEEHDRMRSLLAEFEQCLDADQPGPDERLSTLRWRLVREHMVHSRRESTIIRQRFGSGALTQAHDRAAAAVDDLVSRQVSKWTGATIKEGWVRYRACTHAMISRLRVQMDDEESVWAEVHA